MIQINDKLGIIEVDDYTRDRECIFEALEGERIAGKHNDIAVIECKFSSDDKEI